MSAALLCLWMLALPSLSVPPDVPDTRLIQLETELVGSQSARDLGRLVPARYDEFISDFRLRLESTWSEAEKSTPNVIVNSRIRLRLGDVEAGANKPAIDSILGLGRAALGRGDYAEARRVSEAVLKVDPGNSTAIGLKRLSEGRGETSSPVLEAPAAVVPNTDASSSRPTVTFSEIAKRSFAELRVPPAPVEPDQVPPDGSLPVGRIMTMALAATGGPLLFGGLGAAQLEERYPNIRRNMGLGVVVGLMAGAGWMSMRAGASAAWRMVGTAARASPEATVTAAGLGKAAVDKDGARALLQKMNLAPNQLQSALRAIQRATRSESIRIARDGESLVLKVSRPGRDGFQEFEHVISPDGSKQVIQRAYNAAGQLVHFDPKTR